jgi:hypothetical protein
VPIGVGLPWLRGPDMVQSRGHKTPEDCLKDEEHRKAYAPWEDLVLVLGLGLFG